MVKSDTPEYITWKNMRSRCNRKPTGRARDEKYLNVTVCGRWDSFDNFLEDMGLKPSKDYTIERLDNKVGYCPENCVWETVEKQSRNHQKRRDNTSGVTGVVKYKYGYRALWVVNGKQRSKAFSSNQLGDELAFFAACECREQMIELLNKNGAGYSPNHGK